MWPMILDMSRDECKRILRRLELEAYGGLVSALRAQGELSKEKRKLLQELAAVLNISMERHRAEVRRAVNDEKLATIAEQANSQLDCNPAKRKLMMFFDDISETMLKLSELEQAEIKHEIFNVLNKLDLEMLRKKHMQENSEQMRFNYPNINSPGLLNQVFATSHFLYQVAYPPRQSAPPSLLGQGTHHQ